jgi:hypothetical protein
MASDDYVDDYDMWAGEADDPDSPGYDKCPKCGGKLVKRNGKYGEFYGCENFSSGCKFTCKADYVTPAVLCEKPKEENMETKAATPTPKMTLDDRLKFLELAKDFTIEKPDYANADWEYKISAKDGVLVAFFDKGEFTYCVSGVYNSGSDHAAIDVDEFDRLRAFCEMLKNR